jgi:hypothetical protein
LHPAVQEFVQPVLHPVLHPAVHPVLQPAVQELLQPVVQPATEVLLHPQLFVSQSGEPNVGPKPQQDLLVVEGANISIGKDIASKSPQGSPEEAVDVQESGMHPPKDSTIIFTVRNNFMIVNKPIVTLTATGAPIVMSPQQPSLQPHPQPQPHPQLLLQLGYFNSAAKAKPLPSAMQKGPPWELPQQSNRSVAVVISASVEP